MIQRAHHGCPTCGWLGGEAKRTAATEGKDTWANSAPTTDDPHGHWALYEKETA